MDCEKGGEIYYHKINDKQIQNKIYQFLSNFSERFYLVWWLSPTKTTIINLDNESVGVYFNNTEVYKNSKTDAYFNVIIDGKEFNTKQNETMVVNTYLLNKLIQQKPSWNIF